MADHKKNSSESLQLLDHNALEYPEKEYKDTFQLPHDHGRSEHMLSAKMILDDTDRFRIISDVFRTMSDTVRLRIFWLLCHYEECVVNIASLMDMSSPAVSHHLKTLKDNGLIQSRREGKEVYYRACDSSLCRQLHQMTEQAMEVSCPEMNALLDHSDHIHNCDDGKDTDVVIQKIHELLTVHMEKRWTVEELARMFLMNPTTLKDLFRSTYGNSIAAHIREHRMERAAELLLSTEKSLGEIAREVGYTSQSKFTAAFKQCYHVLPKDYRKAGG